MATIATSRAELARLAGVNRSTAYRWVAAGAPQLEDGSFDVDEVKAWAAQRKARGAQRAVDIRHGTVDPGGPPGEAEAGAADPTAGVGPSDTGTLTHYRIEELRVRTAERQFQLRRRQGEFVERARVAEMLATRMATLRRRTTAAAQQIALELAGVGAGDPMEIEEIVRRHLHAILRQIYEKPATFD